MKYTSLSNTQKGPMCALGIFDPMEVDLDEYANIIFVNAIAKSKVYDPLRDHHDEIRKLATKNKVEGSEFQID